MRLTRQHETLARVAGQCLISNNKQVSLYDFKGHQVRVVELEGNPWFVAADVCKLLSLPNVTMALTRLDPADHQHVRKCNLNSGEVSFPNRGANMVSEAGLYELISGSERPEAKEFRVWVNREVLPSIRKNGGYIKDQEKVDLADDDRGRDPAAAPLAPLRSPVRLLPNPSSPSAPLRSDRSP